MRRVLCVTVMMLVAAGALAQAQPGPTPATKTLREAVVEVAATVLAVDVPTRELALKTPSGEEVVLVVGDEVRNLDKLKVGDQVKVRYKEAVYVKVDKRPGGKPSLTAEEDVSRAAKGSHPGAAIQREVSVSALIEELDPPNYVVTVKGPRGNLVDVIVDNPEVFGKLNIGDLVEITYTRAVAVSVESADVK